MQVSDLEEWWLWEAIEARVVSFVVERSSVALHCASECRGREIQIPPTFVSPKDEAREALTQQQYIPETPMNLGAFSYPSFRVSMMYSQQTPSCSMRSFLDSNLSLLEASSRLIVYPGQAAVNSACRTYEERLLLDVDGSSSSYPFVTIVLGHDQARAAATAIRCSWTLRI